MQSHQLVALGAVVFVWLAGQPSRGESASDQCSGSTCLSLGSSATVTLAGSSSIALGAAVGPPYPSSCRAAWDGNFLNADGLHGTGHFFFGDEGMQYCEMPPKPVSCLDAKDAGFLGTDGTTRSGAYEIQTADDAEVEEVYCDMDVDGGGWTLVANVRASGGWMVDTGSGASALDPSFTFNADAYDPEWVAGSTYYRAFAGIAHTHFLWMTANKQYQCQLASSSVRAELTGEGPNVEVVSSYSTLGETPLAAGELVNVLNNGSVSTHPLVGCQGPNGTMANNLDALLWFEDGVLSTQYTAFKNANGGVGLFVR